MAEDDPQAGKALIPSEVALILLQRCPTPRTTRLPKAGWRREVFDCCGPWAREFGSGPALVLGALAYRLLQWFRYTLRPNGFPSTSACRHGLTDCSGPPHSAQRSRSDS